VVAEIDAPLRGAGTEPFPGRAQHGDVRVGIFPSGQEPFICQQAGEPSPAIVNARASPSHATAWNGERVAATVIENALAPRLPDVRSHHHTNGAPVKWRQRATKPSRTVRLFGAARSSALAARA
jgi:hypothetical protein